MDLPEHLQDPLALQRKLYFLTEQLQKMARDLPIKDQHRIPNELLSDLAAALIDNTVFKIVNTLMDIQHVLEKQLFNQRNGLITNHQEELAEMERKHEDPDVLYANTETLKLKHKMQLKEFDKGCILTLDEKLYDQQKFLEKAGVPGFEVTDDPTKIQVQIRLLDFILQLSQMEIPE
ncbi:Gonadal protein gdl [Nesidiocoris tenuis]|uniref:Gonadal protein gdl n=1 Tax=Nesidiocoris tenuis TaxID=355587 RepID=A0ABN7B964_9HEMI|nr:Gonadal protein gdl [Nesidiocoris tenuis]